MQEREPAVEALGERLAARDRIFIAVDRVDRAARPREQRRRISAAPERRVDVDRVVARRELSAIVEEAMSVLSDEQRTAIILKEYHGMTFQEIADMQGCPLSTVKTRLYQGLSLLRRRLEQQGQMVPEMVKRV